MTDKIRKTESYRLGRIQADLDQRLAGVNDQISTLESEIQELRRQIAEMEKESS